MRYTIVILLQVNKKEKMKIVGKWYFPELNHKEFFGTFYKEDNKLELHIIGELPKVIKMQKRNF